MPSSAIAPAAHSNVRVRVRRFIEALLSIRSECVFGAGRARRCSSRQQGSRPMVPRVPRVTDRRSLHNAYYPTLFVGAMLAGCPAEKPAVVDAGAAVVVVDAGP